MELNLNYLITGAASGIGLEYSKMALTAGGRVVMTDVDRVKGEERLRELRQEHSDDRVVFYQLDVRHEDQWEQVMNYQIFRQICQLN